MRVLGLVLILCGLAFAEHRTNTGNKPKDEIYQSGDSQSAAPQTVPAKKRKPPKAIKKNLELLDRFTNSLESEETKAKKKSDRNTASESEEEDPFYVGSEDDDSTTLMETPSLGVPKTGANSPTNTTPDPESELPEGQVNQDYKYYGEVGGSLVQIGAEEARSRVNGGGAVKAEIPGKGLVDIGSRTQWRSSNC